MKLTSAITLINDDCYMLLKSWPEDAVIMTDPPYGVGFNYGVNRSRKMGLVWGRKLERNRGWRKIHGDEKPFNPQPFLRFKTVCLWGANNFASRLPDSRGWLVWDKAGDMASCSFGDVELAWTSIDMSTRIHHQIWRGVVREGEENVANGNKFHPAQKPVALLMWTLRTCGITKDCLVIDPFMGSGSMGVACHRLGLPYLGVEIDPEYYSIAVDRLKRETSQGLFHMPENLSDKAQGSHL